MRKWFDIVQNTSKSYKIVENLLKNGIFALLTCSIDFMQWLRKFYGNKIRVLSRFNKDESNLRILHLCTQLPVWQRSCIRLCDRKKEIKYWKTFNIFSDNRKCKNVWRLTWIWNLPIKCKYLASFFKGFVRF